jgi:flagellar basal-body rod protein FlgC
MSDALSIAVSGMTAATRRLQISARNVANALSAGPSPDADPAIKANFPAAYTPLRFSQVESAGGGTRGIAGAAQPAFALLYEPNAPYADLNGLVAAPAVDFMDEAIEQLVARYSFAANVAVAKTASAMMTSALDIKA